MHEQPYLRGGNHDIIQIGHTFSNEPGIYIEGAVSGHLQDLAFKRDLYKLKVGVRLEDCFYIGGEGLPIFLTAGVGGQSQDPWQP